LLNGDKMAWLAAASAAAAAADDDNGNGGGDNTMTTTTTTTTNGTSSGEATAAAADHEMQDVKQINNATAAVAAATAQERQLAFFGVNPTRVIDDVLNATDDYVCDGLDALEKAIHAEAAFQPFRLAVGQVRPMLPLFWARSLREFVCVFKNTQQRLYSVRFAALCSQRHTFYFLHSHYACTPSTEPTTLLLLLHTAASAAAAAANCDWIHCVGSNQSIN
jgi:hypothetical protein